MAGRHLYAFMHGKPLGVFVETGSSTAHFAYETSYAGTPLSLSMPLGEKPDEEVAYAYLENLLPENEVARSRLADLVHAPDDTFGLLAAIGEDVAGAAVLSPDPELPSRVPTPPYEASIDQIAYWVTVLKRDPSAPPPDGIAPRFSLAGQQAKFSLSLIGDSWFWSTAEVPSTHIFKPEFEKHRGLQRAEAACLQVAQEVGVLASQAEVMTFRGQEVFTTRRWDRANGARIHAEDLLQAYGDVWSDKYGIYADDARRFMARYGLEKEHLRQVLFNVAIGNSDAHAKNYSLLLAGSQVRLAPIYDTVPMFLWPQYDQNLCITVNGKTTLHNVTEPDWIAWAQQCGYEPELVVTEMRRIFKEVGERLPSAFSEAGLGTNAVDEAYRYVTLTRASLSRPVR